MRRFPLLTFMLAALTVFLTATGQHAGAIDEVAIQNVDYLDVSVDTKGSIGIIGVEYNAPAVDPYGGYDDAAAWRADGSLVKVDHEIGPTYLKPKFELDGIPVSTASTSVRLEAYPRNTTNCSGYDWQAACYWDAYSVENPNHGGIHMGIDRNQDGSWPHIGNLTIPTMGDEHGGFVAVGNIVVDTDLADGDVWVDTFQVDCWFTEVCPQRPESSGGIRYGAFASGLSKGNKWFSSVLWPGRYTLFISDRRTGDKIQVLTDIEAGDVPTIDLNAPCFGFKECVTLNGPGAPSAVASNFHALAPTRILDTRIGLGISNGPVRPGDGSIDTSNDDFRTDEELNHELIVTGHAGVPDYGVAAVLLNITAVDPSADGFITVGPRPQGDGDVFDDQNSFGEWPTSSNLNFSTGQTVPNLVLVRVGAGGRIRFHVHGATTDLLADIAGYFSYSESGAGFTSVTPTRLFDSRQLSEDPFGSGSRRQVQVTGRAKIPSDATAAAINITAVHPTAEGFITAFPSGGLAPWVSNLNLRPNETRPNFAVVSLSDTGSIDLQSTLPYDRYGTVDLIVDVFGYYSDDGGQPTTTTEPFRLVDTRSGIGGLNSPFGSNETRSFRAAGNNGIPLTATAIWANLTVVTPSAEGFLTAYPTGAETPYVSNLNWRPGDINPNMALIPLNSQGFFDISVTMPWDSTARADVLVDVLGWVSPN